MESTTAAILIKTALQQPYFRRDSNGIPPIEVEWDRGNSNTVLVTGENASGKSFLRRVLTSVSERLEWTCLSVSLESRQRPAEIQKIEVYGDERYQATGLNSLRAYIGSIRTAQFLNRRKKPFVLILDEPDCGLSEAASVGLGKSMAEFFSKKNLYLRAAVVISHNKAMMRQLDGCGAHHLRLAGCPNLSEWLVEPERCIEPEELLLAAAERYKRIRPVLEQLEVGK